MMPMIMKQQGFTLIELVVTLMIVGLLATSATPMLKLNHKRIQEAQLRENLRKIRNAIDAYKTAYDAGLIEGEITRSGYPPDLKALTGVKDISHPNDKEILRFIRRIPRDPFNKMADMTPEQTWGLRSYDSEADYPQAGRDVYDIYSRSEETAIDGTKYRDW